MGVKPVEYKRDSSTQGFAVAGDKKDITKTTANTIKKDVDQGNTKDLDNGQQRALESNVDYDTIEYSADENKNVGKNQIDTNGIKGVNTGNAVATTGVAAGSTLLQTGVNAAANAMGNAVTQGSAGQLTGMKLSMVDGKIEVVDPGKITGATKGVGSEGQNVFQNGSDQAKSLGNSKPSGGKNAANPEEAGKSTDETAKIPWAALVAGAIATAGGALALASANGFDPQYKERVSQRDSSEQTNQMIQKYYDELTSNMDSMDADSAKYAELCDLQLQADVSLIDEIGGLQAQIIEYQAQGNTEKVEQLQIQIDDLKEGAEEDTGIRDEMGKCKENIELYASRNAEAQGVSESGDMVSNFLKDGKTLGVLGYIQGGLMTVGALFMLKGTISAVKAAAKIPWPGNILASVVAMAGCALMVAGNVMTALAALKMIDKAKNENQCGGAGDQMSEYVAALNENIEAQAGYTEETSAGYAAADGAAAEEVGKTQEGNDDANKSLAQTLGNSPEDKPKPKPDEDGMAA